MHTHTHAHTETRTRMHTLMLAMCDSNISAIHNIDLRHLEFRILLKVIF